MKKYSVVTYLYLTVVAIVCNFYYPYLNQVVGLDIIETAKVVSLGVAFSIIAQPYIGFKFGNAKSKKTFMLKYFSIVFLIIIVMLKLEKSYILFFAPLYGMFIIPMIGSYEMYIEKLSFQEKFEYSKVRKWGSIGVASITFLSGILISKIGFKGLHLISLILMSIFYIIVLTRFPNIVESEKRKK